jgi:hypothetical protein
LNGRGYDEKDRKSYLYQIDSSLKFSTLIEAQRVLTFYDGKFLIEQGEFYPIIEFNYNPKNGEKSSFAYTKIFQSEGPFVYYQNGIGYGSNLNEGGGGDWTSDDSYSKKYNLYMGKAEDIAYLYKGAYFTETTQDKMHMLDIYFSMRIVQLPSLRLVTEIGGSEAWIYPGGFIGNSLVYYPGVNTNTWTIYNLETFQLKFSKQIIADSIYFTKDLKSCLVDYGKGARWVLVDSTPLRNWLEKNGYLFKERSDTLVEDATLYENANQDAPVKGKAVKGEKVTLLDKSGAVTIIGGRTAFWYKARTASGVEGWIFGAALQSADPFNVVDEALHTAISVKDISTSSLLTEKADLNMYHPVKVFDAKPETGWLEKAEGPGIGESVSIGLEEPILVDTIRVSPGWFDQRYWAQNNRVKSLEILLDGAQRTNANFRDKMEAQDVKLDPPVRFKAAQFIIREIYRTSKWDDTGLAEIEFYYKGHKYPLDIRKFGEYLKKKPGT